MTRAWLLVWLALTACDPKELRCRADNECIDKRGQPGLCLLMHCAFRDPQCTSGYRFDDTAGEDADECVDHLLVPDAALPDARM